MKFDLSTALLCAESSSAAYSNETVGSALAHVYIQELPGVRIIAFRGTHNPMDWLTDGKIRFAEFPEGSGLYVHSGFLESMLSVRDALIVKLKSLPPKPTFITGHSKGGAEARLFTYAHAVPDVAGIYTFGEPRSLGRKASLAYDNYTEAETSFRMIHEEDFVARVPWLCGKYRHSGQEVLLSSIGGYLVNPPVLLKLISDAWGLFNAYRARNIIGLCDDTLTDHFIANYLAAIRPMIPAASLSGESA